MTFFPEFPIKTEDFYHYFRYFGHLNSKQTISLPLKWEICRIFNPKSIFSIFFSKFHPLKFFLVIFSKIFSAATFRWATCRFPTASPPSCRVAIAAPKCQPLPQMIMLMSCLWCRNWCRSRSSWWWTSIERVRKGRKFEKSPKFSNFFFVFFKFVGFFVRIKKCRREMAQ